MENLYHPVLIGNLELPGNLFLAPVAGYSDRAFRSLCYEGGADFGYTEMVSAEALRRGSDKTAELLMRAPGEKHLAVQLFGGDEQSMSQAALIVLENYSPALIDINAGCPVPKIVKTGAGSSLTRDPERLYRIVSAVNETCGLWAAKKNSEAVPVSVKIRSGWDASSLTWKEAAHAAALGGAAAVTLHARTKVQGYEGKSDWTLLKSLVEFFAGDEKLCKKPVFGSGDVFSPEDACSMLEQTGCAAVMFARGAMGNPYVFTQTRQLLCSGSYDEISAETRISAGMRELRILAADRGETAACREMRKRFCSYTKGLVSGAQLRTKIVEASSVKDYENIFFPLLSK